MTKICLLAESEQVAYRFARLQNLNREQYFYAHSETDLLFKSNFHVIVVGETPPYNFEKIYKLALDRGKIGRF